MSILIQVNEGDSTEALLSAAVDLYGRGYRIQAKADGLFEAVKDKANG